ncbi:hypothetical protein C1E24_07785 [Pseudoalteromonas phenolica]|uniref:Uncharacterized protein n=1 Tax=Pseudoalteromonas phenolica TaxID=161398 RepID=A0A5R9Q397_9GAMM|nr:hypothetical protein [Pseudoalteromonas phenolica]TLX47638.1 hypothetical protein C1E24_07785 [Pseudoalteromonas phenolica]
MNFIDYYFRGSFKTALLICSFLSLVVSIFYESGALLIVGFYSGIVILTYCSLNIIATSNRMALHKTVSIYFDKNKLTILLTPLLIIIITLGVISNNYLLVLLNILLIPLIAHHMSKLILILQKQSETLSLVSILKSHKITTIGIYLIATFTMLTSAFLGDSFKNLAAMHIFLLVAFINVINCIANLKRSSI